MTTADGSATGVEGEPPMSRAPAVTVVTETSHSPDAPAVQRLYAAAAALPPLNEPPTVAQLYAEVYANCLTQEGLRVACSWASGELVGFAYGHLWRWREQDYDWAQQLRRRLGETAALVAEGAFVVSLLAVHPGWHGRGLGRRLLRAVVPAGCAAFLVTTDVDSPAHRLYTREGWTELGHGPDAPNGHPGLVLSRASSGPPRGEG